MATWQCTRYQACSSHDQACCCHPHQAYQANYPAPANSLAQLLAHMKRVMDMMDVMPVAECRAKLEAYQRSWRLLYIDTPAAVKVMFMLAFVHYSVASIYFTVQVGRWVGRVVWPGGPSGQGVWPGGPCSLAMGALRREWQARQAS